jgi:hypothetical protein
MAYTINLTDGTVFATINDGTVNTSSSLTLVGKNYAGYGEFLDENFIQLLENFSSDSSGGNPTVSQLASPLTGQLWWDKTNALLKVYNGTIWKTISAATASATQPTSNVTGDLWYDTVNQQVKVYTGSGFIVVGPAFTSSQGTTGAIPETINDSGATAHFVTSLYVNNVRVAIVSQDANFTPAAPIVTNFPTIYTGITLASAGLAGSPALFAGSATNAQLLDNLDSTDFMRATANTATTGRLQVNNANGIYIGTSNVVQISQSTNDGLITGGVSGGNVVIQANVGGTAQTVATALGTGVFSVANSATVGTTLSATGNITGGNINTGGVVSATGNIRGGNVVSVAAVSGVSIVASGNVDSGNLRTSGLISATGNISSAANIAGTFFIGNGSQLTGLSTAVSVTKIVNGTSNVDINASGGNVSFAVGGTANVVVIDTSTVYANVVSVNSIAKTGTNAVGNIGSSSNYFNQVFATATTALYADVAERFAADEVLEPGTVVELGGINEITRAKADLSENVFGVISTKPAYTMNGGAGDDETHPKVAMTGRVPVKVVGIVHKGDRLVSAGSGIARAAQAGEITAFNVIGRSLVDKPTIEPGTIEAIVTIKN